MDNDNTIQQFTKDSERLNLLSGEQSVLKKSLLNKIHTQENISSISPYFSFSHFYRFHKLAVSVIIGFLILIPTAYATETSLPGNPLYFVKTEVVEPLTETLAFYPEVKARVVLNHAHDRLEETAELVAMNNALSEDIHTSSEDLQEKIEDVQKHIQNIQTTESKSKIELQKNLVTVLEAYVAILEQDNVTKEYSDIIATVDNTAEDAEADLIETIEDYSSTADAKTISDETSDLLDEFEETLITASSTDSKDDLSDETVMLLKDALTEAQSELENEDIGEALETLILSDQNTEVREALDMLIKNDENVDEEKTVNKNTESE